MERLTRDEALDLAARHLGTTRKYVHSVAVGDLLARLARALGQDATLWEITGLCHDLDYCATAPDRRRHGLVAAEWLAGRLPEEALDAIRAHDHRAGVPSPSQLAHSLRLADASVTLLEQRTSAEEGRGSATARAAGAPAYLSDLVGRTAGFLGLESLAVESMARQARAAALQAVTRVGADASLRHLEAAEPERGTPRQLRATGNPDESPLQYLDETERDCVRRFVSLLAVRLADGPLEVRLFGSAARGDMWPDTHPAHSDIDLLVVTDQPLPAAVREELEGQTYPLFLECGRQIAPQWLTAEQFAAPQGEAAAAFKARVELEGRILLRRTVG